MMFVESLTAIALVVQAGMGGMSLAEDTVPVRFEPQSSAWLMSQKRPPVGDSKAAHPRAQWLRELNLSADQVQKIQAIRDQYHARLSEQRRAVQQAQQELQQLMDSNASAEQVRQKFDQVQSLKRRLGETRMDSMLAIRAVLTPEQRQKMNELIQRRGNRPGRDRGDEF